MHQATYYQALFDVYLNVCMPAFSNCLSLGCGISSPADGHVDEDQVLAGELLVSDMAAFKAANPGAVLQVTGSGTTSLHNGEDES